MFRIFEASVVRPLTPSGQVEVFDSRGNASKGSNRSRLAAALGAADAGASMGGGKTDSGPSTESGGGKGKVDGTLVAGGAGRNAAQLTGDVQHLTEVARGILAEVRSGNVDPVRLASLQAQLNALPSGILQAAGAAGTMTGSTDVTGIPTTAASSTHGTSHAHSSTGVVTVGGGATNTGTRLEVFKPGSEIRSVDFGGINGSFTWKTLPAKARQALVAWLGSHSSDPAARAFNSRTGTGWTFDPNAVIVMEAGYAQFVGGMSLVRTPATAPVSGGGASTQAVGHDATRPPVSGGGGTSLGSVPPSVGAPIPVVSDPGDEHDHADEHAHAH
jgi:hypothetical protein